MDKALLRERLQGWAEFNEWEREYKRRHLRQLSLEERWRQFEEVCAFARQLAPRNHPRLVQAKLNLLARLRRDTERMEAWRRGERLY